MTRTAMVTTIMRMTPMRRMPITVTLMRMMRTAMTIMPSRTPQ